jgi:hypothetical protein
MREVKVTLILSTDHYGYMGLSMPAVGPGWRLSTYVTEPGTGKEYGNNQMITDQALATSGALDYILERAVAELKQAIRGEGVTLAQKESQELTDTKAELAKLRKIKDAIATIKDELE